MWLRNSFQKKALINYVFLMGINPGPRDRSGFLGLLTTPAATSAAQIHTHTHSLVQNSAHLKWLYKGTDCHPSLENKEQRKKPQASEGHCAQCQWKDDLSALNHGAMVAQDVGRGLLHRGITQGRRQ